MTSSFDICFFDLEMLCLYLAILWFVRAYNSYGEREKSHRTDLGRNNYEQISESIDESKTEL